MTRFHTTVATVEKQEILHILSVCVHRLSYLACVVIPSYVEYPTLTILFSALSLKHHDFREKILNIKGAFFLLFQFV